MSGWVNRCGVVDGGEVELLDEVVIRLLEVVKVVDGDVEGIWGLVVEVDGGKVVDEEVGVDGSEEVVESKEVVEVVEVDGSKVVDEEVGVDGSEEVVESKEVVEVVEVGESKDEVVEEAEGNLEDEAEDEAEESEDEVEEDGADEEDEEVDEGEDDGDDE